MTDVPPDPARPVVVSVEQKLLAGQVLWRVHSADYDANSFYHGDWKYPTRFAPIEDAGGALVPVLYAGIEPPGALFESIFHDVPPTGVRTAPVARLQKRMLSRLELSKDVRLADLTMLGLPSLGVLRQQLIESNAVHYPVTGRWSEAIHNDNDVIEGLYWISKQNDRHSALMLFGSRVLENAVAVQHEVYELWHDEGFALVATWAEAAKITLV